MPLTEGGKMPKEAEGKKDNINRTVKHRLGDALDIPYDVLQGGCTVELRGNGEAYVSGCRKIIDFTDITVRLSMSDYDLVIEGESLVCPGFGAGKMAISGRIKRISFEDRGM